MNLLRRILWRILGIDFELLKRKTDYNLLKSDGNTTIGNGSYDNGAKVWRWTNANLIIGNYCSIAYDVHFIVDDGFHKGSAISNYPFINNKNINAFFDVNFSQRSGITIGNDVWIGIGALIMPGVNVGNGAIIGANTVVTVDVPDYAVFVGCPGKIVKMKYTEKQIEALNRIKWWEWPSGILTARKLDFYNLSIDLFIQKYDN